MNFSLLDNAAWHALNSYHQHLAIKGQSAARYQPDVFFAAGLAENTQTEFSELRTLAALDDMLVVVGSIPANLEGWAVVSSHTTQQMVCEELNPSPRLKAITLTDADVPEMLELVRLTQPGPFLRRTIVAT